DPAPRSGHPRRWWWSWWYRTARARFSPWRRQPAGRCCPARDRRSPRKCLAQALAWPPAMRLLPEAGSLRVCSYSSVVHSGWQVWIGFGEIGETGAPDRGTKPLPGRQWCPGIGGYWQRGKPQYRNFYTILYAGYYIFVTLCANRHCLCRQPDGKPPEYREILQPGANGP